MKYFAIVILMLVALQATPKHGTEKAISTSSSVNTFLKGEDSIKDNEDFICHFFESQPAEFPGREDSLSNFITSNYNQPDAVPDSVFTKRGKLQFTIGENGKIEAFEIRERLGYGCDEEIIRILKLTRWKPAMNVVKGKPIKDYRLLPYIIKFESSDEEKTNSNTSPRSEPACPPQTLSVISE